MKQTADVLCAGPGCTNQCIDDGCVKENEGTCAIGRRHYIKGGVGCLSDSRSCAECGGAFWNEDLKLRPGMEWSTDPSEQHDQYWDDCLCHCCLIRARNGE